MNLDVATLSVVTVFVTALLGALLVFGGLQNRNIRSLMWWGASYIAGAAGLALLTMRDSVPEFFAVDCASALMLFAYGLVWAGARLFDGRKVSVPLLFVAPGIWLVARLFPLLENANARIVVVSLLLATLLGLSASEFWRGRAEPLLSRWPTIVVLLVYMIVILVRLPAVYFSPFANDLSVLHWAPFTIFAFGTLLFTVVMAFLLLNMTKERTELQHKLAAMVDPLTGIANRRAFFGGAQELFAQQVADGRPVATLLFDLDRFKDINDRFGHSVGDRVLQCFASTGTATLGGDVLFVRLGGEEFAALLPVGDLDEAYAIADRVRRNFAAAAARHGSRELKPTVSAGVALGRSSDEHDAMMADADRALYRAKARGRDRVETTQVPAEHEAVNAPSIVPFATGEGSSIPILLAGHRRRSAG